MTLPSTYFGLVVVVALVVPGLVFAAVRVTLSGFLPHDRSVGTRVIQAVLVSAVLDSIYTMLFGTNLASAVSQGKEFALTHPVFVGSATFFLGIIVPALAAYVMYGDAVIITRVRRLLEPSRRWLAGEFDPNSKYRQAPSAWDWVAGKKGDTYVRLLNAQGRWIGGWFSSDAFYSSYPEPRDLYIPRQWRMSEAGEFLAEIEETEGVWVNLENAQLVEWVRPKKTSEIGNEHG